MIDSYNTLEDKYKYINYLEDDLSLANKDYFLNETLILSTPEMELPHDIELMNGYKYKKGFKFKYKYVFLNADMIEGIRPTSYNNLGTMFFFKNTIDFMYFMPFTPKEGMYFVPNNINLKVEKMNYKEELDPRVLQYLEDTLKNNGKELV